MSVIGVEKTEKKIRLVSDSQSTTGDDKALIVVDPKVFQVGNIAMGVTGNVITKQYLKKYLEVQINKSETKSITFDSCYEVCEFMQGFFQAHKDNERLCNKEYLGSVIVTDGDKVFTIDLTHFSCYEVLDFWFIGSGAYYAEGAYLALGQVHENEGIAFDPLESSIKIACERDLHCGLPIHLLEIDRPVK